MLRQLGSNLRLVALGFLGAVVPSPERDRIEHDHCVDVALFSLLLGAIEAPAGVVAFMLGGVRYVQTGSVIGGMALLENWWPGLHNFHFQGVGLLSWLAWFLHPLAWLTGMFAATGVLRCVGFAATRVPVSEPLVAAACVVLRAARRAVGRAQERALFGPERDDRIENRNEGEVVVYSARPKPDWNERVTIEIGGRFYRLAEARTESDGGYAAWSYRLREERQANVIRKLIRYE